MQTTSENPKNKAVRVAPQTASKNRQPKFTDNSSHNQRSKILVWLFERGSITTAQAREYLDVMHPAGRIRELRHSGYLIVTVWIEWVSDSDIRHRVANYVLTHKQPTAHEAESS